MLWLVIALVLFVIQILTILIGEFRHPSKAMAWLFVLFIIPVIGFVVYYFLATEYSQRKKVKRKGLRLVKDIRHMGKKQIPFDVEIEEERLQGWRQEPRLFALLNNMPGSQIMMRNEVKVLTNASVAYPAILEAMEKAERFIHFEFYTIRHDATGRKFQDVLMRKAREGVKVRCIFDGIGSYQLSEKFIGELKQAGCEVYFFLPALIAFFDKRINYRNHRKIVVVDGLKGFLGGMNIGDEYLGGNPKLGFWRDTHIAFEGDAVYALQNTFLTDWHFVSGYRLTDTGLFPEHECAGRKPVQILSSGPDAHWDTVLEMYFGAITTAKKRIFITTPYFIPEASIIMGLKTAAISGVDVRVIYPKKPDSRIVNYASLSFMEELMQAGVRFYAYHKGFVHAKVILIDHLLASVGTANMDMRSFYSNFEMNAVLFDKETLQRIESDYLQDLKDSRELKLDQFERRSRYQKGKEVVARLLSPLM
ncbi:cardiolipin synthase [Paenibacillus validus]|uniref:Cardiolipin synthase n=1 Tax=Paenibacillus validus TaxID=44253 RepID=A0A7X2ZD28_9BACL|nr:MULTISPECIES: cardiolipin synthase [Paenibacillus]MED4602878.1 cardiolipin synthase [Paenibacillus validus]MED4607164.1 cardiolipin synthase [Paenibacillus validus]MUG72095.1 cardiolipin synthase [Paenibacillus validus]